MKRKVVVLLSIIVILTISLIININYNNLKEKSTITTDKPIKNENRVIAAYIKGEISTSFPTTNDYSGKVKCHDKNGNAISSTAKVKWNGTKWVVNISNLTDANAKCNVYFIDPEPDGWSDAEEGTLIAALKSNQATANKDTASGMTTPGKQFPRTNEGLRLAEDDYGTSFYYRGGVENNYVVFAGMCWRIVRVDGAGNTKLVLYNYNPNEVNNPCASTEDGDTNAFARISGTTYQSSFNSTYSSNAYVGFMYGSPGASTYDAEHANTNKSAILQNLETWYNEKLVSYESNLADTIWCNDKSIVTDTTYNPYSTTPTGLGYNQEITYYGAMYRILPSASSSPTLVCQDASGSNAKLSKFTVNDTTNGNGLLTKKIGLLTIDETIYAGVVGWSDSNNACYLTNNASSIKWWTLSPGLFSGSKASLVYSVDSNYTVPVWVNDSLGLRPAVSLKSTTSVTTESATNPGTASNPFIVS